MKRGRMSWNDLEEGDVVVPLGTDSDLWLVLKFASAGEERAREMTYVNLGTGAVYRSLAGRGDVFHPHVQVMRGWKDVNG